MSNVYIVMSGIYWNDEYGYEYAIDKIFKSREKAELYCECQSSRSIEEWDFSDDEIHGVCNVARIEATLYPKIHGRNILFSFKKYLIEDELIERNKTHIWTNGYDLYNVKTNVNNKIKIVLDRELPKNYSKDKVKLRYEGIMEDLASEIEYEFSDVDILDDEAVTEFVKRRLGVKEREYEE